MDSIVSAALEEVCSQGTNGLALLALWPKLQPSLSSHGLRLCTNVKKVLWSNLLKVPGLQFEAGNVTYTSEDPTIQSAEESEKLNLKIVASESLRNSFVGIYDIKASDAGISQPQRRVLERLAIARTNGITQSELAKELGVKGNNIFYVLRNLECRGLIVRQSTIVRTKETCNEGESKNSSIVNTNMLHLFRYAKHLGCQQRIEITKEDKTLADDSVHGSSVGGDAVSDECVIEDVHVKDYLPALKAICDKLEKADGKVLVVSDIKQDLGYRGTSGHRAWRNICHRLKDAHVVEEFCAEVNKKEVSCLRLLKKFSPKNFGPKSLGCKKDELETEQLMKTGKRYQITDQLVELPIEHQIYDLIDSEGSKGMTITEVCKKLGINNKRYYNRLLNMFSRFGMHLEAESHNRGVAYRVWTSGNFNPKASDIYSSKSENVFAEHGASDPCVGSLTFHEKSSKTTGETKLDYSTSKADVQDTGETENRAIEQELCHRPPAAELPLADMATVSSCAPLETPSVALSTARRIRSYQRYPCLTLAAANALREQRILQKLEVEKFIIRAELRRLLESLEKDGRTMMDRRTLDRTLNKLQQEGRCKCIRVSVPVITNCGRSRTTEVVLHPSASNVSPELLGQIHDRMRSFDMEIRGQGSSRVKKGELVPVLNGVQRILKSAKLDVQAERYEAMRANGFVLAKMVRTKLLHIFLWGYLSSSPGWNDTLSSGKHGYDLKNPHSTCELFALDAAIKAMPLELFLQIVGSTQKFEDMIQKCRIGLRLCDLPEQEYKRLMDHQATCRLSWLIDILRRLKLIRMVSDRHSEDESKVPHATLAHALELKPYIEEPVLSIAPSSELIPLDLRPQIRHDFILSSRKSVDEYWSTLEYCYAAADSKAALHAFPGSAVHEVFLFRSWASVRVMTADQRAELLKRIVNDYHNKRLSFKECEKIANDLNLTLEQVLRVYYDKRRQRLTRFQGVLNAKGEEFQPLRGRQASSSRKRKRSSDRKSSKHKKNENVVGQSGRQRLTKLSDTDDQFTEEEIMSTNSSEENDSNSENHHDDDFREAKKQVGLNEEDDEHHSFIHECALSKLKPARQRKFSWSEAAERKLVIEYVRHRSALGAKFHRTDWASLSELPAPPDTCKRRMALLNGNLKFRKAIMKLCNMLGERYAKHLVKLQKKILNHGDSGLTVRDSFGEDCNKNFSNCAEHTEEGFEDQWDDFDNKNLRTALDEAFRYKRMAKLEASKGVRSVSDEWLEQTADAVEHDTQGTKLVSSATSNEEAQNHDGRHEYFGQRSRRHRLPRKYIKLLSDGIRVSRRAYESLAVSNASELFKLVFLSSSTAAEAPNLLAETLRRYSENDLFAAFNHLREKKIMVGGYGNSPFVLSQQFLQSISSSPFPVNTGKRASKFARWLHEREVDLMEEGLDLTADLQCGDIFHLFALVSSGEIAISPCLPDEGVGEAEDSRNSKRKLDNSEYYISVSAKKLKTSLAGESEIISRREKGFPGIRLFIGRSTISRIDAMELFKDGDICSGTLHFCENNQVDTTPCLKASGNSCHSDHMEEILNFEGTVPASFPACDSPWEAMTNYAKHVISSSCNQEEMICFCPNLFKSVYSVIQKAGDQGLSMEEVSQVINMQGEKIETIIEVLKTFGRVLKVNSYHSVHVVDSLYKSKYFLTSVASLHRDLKVAPPTNFKGMVDRHLYVQPENHEDDGGTSSQTETSMNTDEVHKVTILNLPEVISQPSCETSSNELEGCNLDKCVPTREHSGGNAVDPIDSRFCMPILPWMNGDGTVNTIVYKGLVRRLIGLVMQNPGILEDDIIRGMDIVNPQSCRNLLELMVSDNRITVRKMLQTTSDEPPALLGSLLGSNFKKSKFISRKHFFANPMSTDLL